MAFPNHMRADEQKIVEALIRKALDKGYTISVFDGVEWALRASTDFEVISAEINATDITQLRFRVAETRVRVGDVLLIHGNGEDVVSDCSDVEAILELVDG